MKLSNLTTRKDTRTNCYSAIFEMTVQDYIQLVEKIFNNKGGLKEQREPLKTSSAIRIRKQMIKDILAGTILPPIVLGIILEEEQFSNIQTKKIDEIQSIVSSIKESNITIIDGMQRTTSILQAIDEGLSLETIIRVEFWIANKLNSLIYRMLILNTGQVPWNLRRQIETVFSSMIEEIQEKVKNIELYKVDDANRRTKGGQYHANDIIELYLAFGGRKEKVDTKERLADEFTRLDFIEATENKNFSDDFYDTLQLLTSLDIEISNFESKINDLRFSSGKDIFKSQPAKVGFVTAISKKIYGRPGVEKKSEQIEIDKTNTFRDIQKLIDKINKFSPEQLESFLSLVTLSEKLNIKSSRVGDFEREFFTKAFETLIEENEGLASLEICWQSF